MVQIVQKPAFGFRSGKIKCEPVKGWFDWKVAWQNATTTPERLGLVHTGFDLNLNTVYDLMSPIQLALDTVAVTERYRYYLHIADVESGFPAMVRKRAFEVLFGSKNLPLLGIFPKKNMVDERELRSLLWFLRRGSSTRIRNCDSGVLATEGNVSNMAHERAQSNFWENLQPLLLGLWFGKPEVADRVKNPLFGTQLRSWQKSILLHAILYSCGVEPLRKEILRARPDQWSVFAVMPEAALEELRQRVGCFDELALVNLKKCNYYLKRGRFHVEETWRSFLDGDQIAEFIAWLEYLKTDVIPTAEKELEIKQAKDKLRELQRKD